MPNSAPSGLRKGALTTFLLLGYRPSPLSISHNLHRIPNGSPRASPEQLRRYPVLQAQSSYHPQTPPSIHSTISIPSVPPVLVQRHQHSYQLNPQTQTTHPGVETQVTAARSASRPSPSSPPADSPWILRKDHSKTHSFRSLHFSLAIFGRTGLLNCQFTLCRNDVVRGKLAERLRWMHSMGGLEGGRRT